MPQITATATPKDVYTELSITANKKVQIQNKSTRPLHIFAGDATPGNLEDYFIVDSWVWDEYQGAVIVIYSENGDIPVMVQDVS